MATESIMAPAAFEAHLVEIGARAVGVIAREADGYRFFAVEKEFRALENQVFDSAEIARSAALYLHREADSPRARRSAPREGRAPFG